MRKSYPSFSLLTLGGLFLAASCSIIAEVDRTKIPTDGGTPPPEGGQSTGGSSNTGGTGTGGKATGGSGPTGGSSGASGAGGEGGETGGTSGTGGDAGGGMGGAGAGGAGAGGEGGSGGPVCGDGLIEGAEACDDGDPPANGDGCNTTCAEEAGWNCTMTPSVCVAAMCGDRIVAGAEVCDDGNGNACGTCTGNCSAATPSAAASGSISPGLASALVDGETFTLNDGSHTAVVFEFDIADDGVSGTNTEVTVTGAATAAELQAAIVTAIDGVTTALAIDASNGTAPNVNLVNDVAGVAGNQTSAETVVDAGFTITAMTGGAAENCANGTGCRTDQDCVGTCNMTSHLCE